VPGVGAEVARRLHAKGAKLVLTDLDEPPLHDLAADLTSERLLTLVADIRDFAGMQAAVSRAIDRRGYVLIVSSLAAYAAVPGLAPYNAANAAVEHFANALRLEVAYRGVDVGSAHMSWIDTPLVQEAKSDLPAFREMLSKLPGPLSKTTSVEACGEAFVKGIEARKRQINCLGRSTSAS
jgi:NAD(P)-dependent dehydrogenase (short-subunit alcohol dehydrogenase family)